MTEEDKNAAAAYLKLQDDVRKLVVDLVVHELRYHVNGELCSAIANAITPYSRMLIDREINNYRITYRGTTANF